ncbi:MAG: hypothetical protein QCI82_06725 [Candidatus Thermoplasmatota archaeon]|nr:hypothetical protein [Candidatus Thermoplasmatota archaeon]
MRKKFDSVKMMRDIREELSLKYPDPASQEEFLKKVRKKYMN